ncbi:Ms4533A family Cys-rich leader peptide [Streptomyces sp. NPDC003943]
MSNRAVNTERALELALFGVTGHAVADILCR